MISSTILVLLVFLFYILLTTIGQVNVDNEAPLLIACRDGHDIQRIEYLLNEGHNPNVKNSLGWTPLAFAVNKNDEEMSRTLINAGAFVNEPENDVIYCHNF